MLFSKCLICLFGLFTCTLFANSLSVIVSKKSFITSMNKNQLSQIFLAKTKSLPNGAHAIRLELDNEKYKKYFYKKITNKNTKQLKKYWTTMIFTGRGVPPKKMKTTQEIINFVKNNSNAIAYLPRSVITNQEINVVMEIE